MNHRALFEVNGLPVFQNKMFDDYETAVACPKGDVALVQDMNTGLIFNAAFNSNLLLYNTDYQNEQAFSNVFQRHLQDVNTVIGRYFFGKTLIEVGCGKGYFFENLLKHGYDITGIDPAYEGNNPKVIKAYFDASLGLAADGIILRHVLEHITNPFAFLATIAQANRGKGLIYIEVPCFDWICDHHAWFDVFYEHVNYFRLTDFHRMFGKVHESGRLFGGQYIYVIADLATLQPPILKQNDAFSFPDTFLSGIDQMASLLGERRNTIWGGASKGVLFALYMQKAEITIDQAIDINPAKQNKYMAGTGVRILAPNDALPMLHPGDNIIVMNSNYLQEIIDLSHNQFHYIQADHHEL